MSARTAAAAPAFAAALALALALAAAAPAAAFTYNPAGTLKAGSGTGLVTSKNWVPGMRFPIQDAPAYLNSQVYGNGGLYGPGGGQCDKANFSYPWWDNYCEKRSWSMPLCPAGKGHQGQDIRASTCSKNVWWAVATLDGTITSIGTYSVYLKGSDGKTHRFLHLDKASLAVKTGQKVSKGQKIGKVSNEFGGTPTSVHLHWDLNAYVSGVGNAYVSPYLALVESYKVLVGAPTPSCDAAACKAKSSCGAWSACGGFKSVCDETGSKTRTCTTYACAGGDCKASSASESAACTVATAGKVVEPWSPWSECGGQQGECEESGKKTRTRKVCTGGAAVVESEQQACAIVTDGKALGPWSDFGPCVAAGGLCPTTGSQSRSRSVCSGGKAAQIGESKACAVDSDGEVVEPWGAWSVCLPGLDPCKGVRQRQRKVCKGGAVVVETQAGSCAAAGCGVDAAAADADDARDAATATGDAAAADAASAEVAGGGDAGDDGVLRDPGDAGLGSGDTGLSGGDTGIGGGDAGFTLAPAPPSGCAAGDRAPPTLPGLALVMLAVGALWRRRRAPA